ncbi:Ig-like domain-containing protein, partial [Chromohalobacter sp. 48-RD10]|uniref:Ig-like domain-containing protein n=1 Tax=Chromohalobacter sp. 48-RD10 TaxID=2994063 RepID=UPI002469BC2E
SATLDQTPPALTIDPVDDPISNDSPALSGSVDDPDATVTVTVDGTDYTATVDGNSWTLPDGTVDLAEGDNAITVNATDPAGNPATLVTETVSVDVTAPAEGDNTVAFADDVYTAADADTADLTGQVEDGGVINTLTVASDAGGEPVVIQGDDITLEDDGSFTTTADLSGLDDGELTATLSITDAAGNTGTVTDTATLDTVAPDAPTIDPTNGTELTGTAEVGSTVTLTNGNGDPIGEPVTVGDDGTWTVTPEPPLEDGDEVTATATDPAGNTSDPTTKTVDGIPPAEGDNSITIVTGDDALLSADEAGNVTLTGQVEDGASIASLAIASANGGGPLEIDPATVTPDTDGSFSLDGVDVNGLDDGELTATLSITDAAGNTGTVTDTATLDTVAPDVPTIDPTNGDDITGTAEPGSTVTVTDDNGATIGEPVTVGDDGTWTVTPETPLVDGTEISAIATDEAGNVSPETTATVDATAPDAPVIAGAVDDVDPAGQLDDADVTNDTTPTLNGSAEANATIAIFADGAPIGTTDAGENGDWSFTLADANALPDGDVNFTAMAIDGAGNTSDSSEVFTLTIDDTAPQAPTIEPTTGDTITGTAEVGSTVTLTNGNGDPIGEPVVADGDGNWSVTPDEALADGDEINAVATDEAGNASPEATATVDANAPDVPVIVSATDDVAPLTDDLASGDNTNDTTPTLTGTAEANSTIEIFQNGTSVGMVDADGDGSWNFTPEALSEGNASFTATATDAAGNTSPDSNTFTLTIDVTAPAGNDGTHTIAFDNGGDGLLSADEADNVTLSGQIEAGATIDSIVIRDSDDTTDDITVAEGDISVVDGQVSVAAQDLNNLSDGKLNATMTVVDSAGNSGDITDTTTLDTTADVDPPATLTSNDADGLINADEADTTRYTVGGLDDDAIAVATFTDGTTAVTADVTADGTFNVDLSGLADGAISSELAITDNAGNTATVTGDSVTLDTTADVDPPATLTSNDDDGLINADEAGSTRYTVSALDDDATAVATFTDVNGDTAMADVAADGSITADLSNLADGEITSSLAITDNAGNTATVTGDSVTLDTTADVDPTATLTSNDDDGLINADEAGMTRYSVSGMDDDATAVATFTDTNGESITTTVEADGDYTVDFAGLVDGEITSSLAITDEAGNSATVVGESITLDTIAPEAPSIEPTDGVLITGTAEAGATITLTDGDDSSIGTTTAGPQGSWSFAPATPLVDGTVINASATDAAGNAGPVANTTVDADLNDVTPPEAPTIEFAVDDVNPQTGDLADGDSTNDTRPLLQGIAEADSTVAISLNGSEVGSAIADDQGNWSYARDEELPEGDAVFTATATDGNGNTSDVSDAFTLTVDTETPDAPMIASAADNVAPAGTLNDGASTNDTTPTLTGSAEAGSTVEVFQGDTSLGTTEADDQGNWSFTPETELAEGDVSFTAEATDAAGNTSPASDAFTLTIDTTAPDTPIIEPTNGDDITGTAEPGSTVTVTDENGATIGEPVTVGDDGTWTVTPETPLEDGDEVTATATDPAGNTSDPATETVDAVAPNDGNNTVNFADEVYNADDADTATLTGKVEDNAAIDTLTIASANGGDPVVIQGDDITLEDDGSFTTTADLSSLDDGELTATLSLTDAAGNTGTVTDTATLDTMAPEVADATVETSENDLQFRPQIETTGTLLLDSDEGSAGSEIASLNITAPQEITSDGDTVSWEQTQEDGDAVLTGTTGGDVVATLRLDNTGNYTFTQSRPFDHPSSGADVLSLGFDVAVTDLAGNVGTGTLTLDVTDAVPTASADRTFGLAGDANSANGDFAVNFGADGGYVQNLSIGGYTLTYDPEAGTVTTEGEDADFALSPAFDAASGTLTVSIGDHKTLTVDMNTGEYQYDSAVQGSAPQVSLDPSDDLLGLVGVDAVGGLVSNSSAQAFQISDADNDVTEVVINAETGSLANLGIDLSGDDPLNFNYSMELATALGIDVVAESDSSSGLLGIGASASATLTITAINGGTINNQALNTFLSSVQLDESGFDILNVGGSSISLEATDAAGNSDSSSDTSALDVGLLSGGSSSASDIFSDTASDGDDVLSGDALSGGAGNDWLFGTGNDAVLDGGSGDDILVGGSGNATLTGGSGNDTFQWRSGDQGTVDAPSEDTVTDFSGQPLRGGGDTLDLRGLLDGGRSRGTSAGNLTSYLYFALAGASTVVYVSAEGAFADNMNATSAAAQANQIITLEGVDLIGASGDDQSAIIGNLLANGNLLTNNETFDSEDDPLTNTSVGATIVDGDGDPGTTSVNFDHQSDISTSPNAPTVQATDGSLLGLIGVEALGILDLSQQAFTAADPDNGLQQVEISYQALASLSLGTVAFVYSEAMAEAFGYDVSVETDSLVGVAVPSSTVTVTAEDGSTLDNLEINEFLATLQLDTGSLDLAGLDLDLGLSALGSFTVSATDVSGETTSDGAGNLLDVAALNRLLGLNGSDYILEGDSGDNVLDANDGGQRLYGYAGDDTLNGGSGNDLLRAGSGDDTLNGGDGDDILIGGNGADTFNAGAGDDLMVTSGTDFASIDGGEGFDTLLLDGGIDLTSAEADSISNIEQLDLGHDDDSSSATLSEDDALEMTDADNELQVTGDEQDTLNIQGASQGDTITADGVAYDQYTFGDATIQVEQDTVTVET